MYRRSGPTVRRVTGLGRLGGYFWPAEVKVDSLEDFVRVYELLGFQVCESSAFEPEVERSNG